MMVKRGERSIPEVVQGIVEIRGQKVMLDGDLAAIYGASTKAFNQAIRRNASRFPADFAFQLTAAEFAVLRSQIVTSKPRRGGRRYLPWAFTEHGAIMAATILNSPRAIEMSLFVVRAFVRLRTFAREHAELAEKVASIERRLAGHDEDLEEVFAVLRALVTQTAKPRKPIGFGRASDAGRG